MPQFLLALSGEESWILIVMSQIAGPSIKPGRLGKGEGISEPGFQGLHAENAILGGIAGPMACNERDMDETGFRGGAKGMVDA